MKDRWLEVRRLDDDELIEKVDRLVGAERENLVEIIVHLSELDRRHLPEESAYPSLYLYCTQKLGYSEAEAYLRIHTARAAVDFPIVLDLIEEGRLHMAAVTMLTPHLTTANHLRLLEAACGKSKRDVEIMIARMAPQRELAECIRRAAGRSGPGASLPLETITTGSTAPVAAGSAASAAPGSAAPTTAEPGIGPREGDFSAPAQHERQSIKPFAPDRIRFAFNGSEEMLWKVERARQLLRHKFPAGRLEDIFDDALEALLDKRDPDRRIARIDRRRALAEARSHPETRLSTMSAQAI